jgi:hypothetical protein
MAAMDSPFLQRWQQMHEARNDRRDDWITFNGDCNTIKGHMHEDWTTKKVAYTRARSEGGWNYTTGWGFHKDGHGPEDKSERPGIWLAEDIDILSGRANAPRKMTGNKLESYIIALSYSVPDGVWPDSSVNACRYWFVRYGETLSCEWNAYIGRWKWKYGLGAEKGILTREKISLALRTAPEHFILAAESDRVAGKMMEALESAKVFDDKEYVIDDLYQEEEEQEMARTLYEVFIVDTRTEEVIDVTQVVSDSEDKAKMKAFSGIEWGDTIPADVDLLDFFAVEIGGVRKAPDSCSC